MDLIFSGSHQHGHAILQQSVSCPRIFLPSGLRPSDAYVADVTTIFSDFFRHPQSILSASPRRAASKTFIRPSLRDGMPFGRSGNCLVRRSNSSEVGNSSASSSMSGCIHQLFSYTSPPNLTDGMGFRHRSHATCAKTPRSRANRRDSRVGQPAASCSRTVQLAQSHELPPLCLVGYRQ